MAGQFGGWTPIGAEQTASGYQVAWKLTGADQYIGLVYRQQRQLHLEPDRLVVRKQQCAEIIRDQFPSGLEWRRCDRRPRHRHGDRGGRLDQPGRGGQQFFPRFHQHRVRARR